MTHYGVSREEAESMIAEKGVAALVPVPRGAKVQTSVNWTLVATGVGAIISGIAMIWVGTRPA